MSCLAQCRRLGRATLNVRIRPRRRRGPAPGGWCSSRKSCAQGRLPAWSAPRWRPPPRCGTQTSMAPAGSVKTLSRRCRVSCSVTARPRRPASPPPCACCARVRPLSCPCPPHAHAATHGARPRPTRHGDAPPLHGGDADHTVQGSPPPPPPPSLPCQGALTPCHRLVVRGASPPRDHVLRRRRSLPRSTAAGPQRLARGTAPSVERADRGDRHAPLGARGAQFEEPKRSPRRADAPAGRGPSKKSLPYAGPGTRCTPESAKRRFMKYSG